MQADGRSNKGDPFCKRGHVKVVGQPDCRECVRIRKEKFDALNPDYYDRYKGGPGSARNKAWFDKQTPERQETIRVKIRARVQAWRKANPERVAVGRARASQVRKARLRAGGKFTPKDFDAVKERQNHKCFDCKRGDVRLTVGHLLPISKGGTNALDNIVAQCMSCNHKQGARVHPYLQNG